MNAWNEESRALLRNRGMGGEYHAPTQMHEMFSQMIKEREKYGMMQSQAAEAAEARKRNEARRKSDGN